MKPLKQGDPCRVRLHTGEVVDAIYDEPYGVFPKDHFVEIKGHLFVATSTPHIGDDYCPCDRVRFVGPSCDLINAKNST
jgi:hypothetical protein